MPSVPLGASFNVVTGAAVSFANPIEQTGVNRAVKIRISGSRLISVPYTSARCCRVLSAALHRAIVFHSEDDSVFCRAEGRSRDPLCSWCAAAAAAGVVYDITVFWCIDDHCSSASSAVLIHFLCVPPPPPPLLSRALSACGCTFCCDTHHPFCIQIKLLDRFSACSQQQRVRRVVSDWREEEEKKKKRHPPMMQKKRASTMQQTTLQIRSSSRMMMMIALMIGLACLLACTSSFAPLLSSVSAETLPSTSFPNYPGDPNSPLRSCSLPFLDSSPACAPPFANLLTSNITRNLAAATLVGYPLNSADVSERCLNYIIPPPSFRGKDTGVRISYPLAFATGGWALNYSNRIEEKWAVELQANPCDAATGTERINDDTQIPVEYPYLEWNISMRTLTADDQGNLTLQGQPAKVTVQLLGLGQGYAWDSSRTQDPEFFMYDIAYLPLGPTPPDLENITNTWVNLKSSMDVCAEATNAKCRPFLPTSGGGNNAAFSLAQEGIKDQQKISAAPTADISVNATFTYYRRLFPIPPKWSGLIANAFMLSVDMPLSPQISIRIRNIQIVDANLKTKRIVYPPVSGYTIANYSLSIANSDPTLGVYDNAANCIEQSSPPNALNPFPTTRNCTNLVDYNAILTFSGSFWPVNNITFNVRYGSATLNPATLGLLIIPCTILSVNSSQISCRLTQGYPDSMRFRVCDSENFICSAVSGDSFVYPPAIVVGRSMFDQAHPEKTYQHFPPDYFIGPNPGYLFLGFKFQKMIVPSAVAIIKPKNTALFSVWYGPANEPRKFRCQSLPVLASADTAYCIIDSSAFAQSFQVAFMRFTFLIGYQTFVSNMTFSYRAYPVIRSLSSGSCTRALDGVGLQDCPTIGGYSLTLRGDSLFPPFAVRMNGSPCTNATILGDDADAMTCIVPALTGSSVSIVVSAAFTLVPYTFTSFSYSAPRVDSITGCASDFVSLGFVITSGCKREGDDNLIITGSDFGAEGANVFVGGRACKTTTHDPITPHSILYCLTPKNAGTRLPLGIAQKGGSTTSDPTRAVGYTPCAPGSRELSALELLNPATELQGCVECTAGKFTSVYGSSECTPCQLGFFSNSTGAFACTPCPPRTKGVTNTTSGINSCEICPTFTQGGTQGSTECISCLSTDFAQLDSKGDFIKCTSCPDHTLCLTNSTTNVVLAQSDYWITQSKRNGAVSAYRCDPGKCYPCNPSQIATAIGGSITSAQFVSNTSGGFGVDTGAITGVISCCGPNRLQPAALNPLCASCASGYVEAGSDCVSCDSPNVGLIVLIIFASLVYIIIFHRVAQSTSGLTKIFLYHMSTIVTLLGPQTSLVVVFNLFNFNLGEASRSTCIAPMSDGVKLLLGVILPFVSLLMLFTVFVVHITGWRFCSRARMRASNDPRLNRVADMMTCPCCEAEASLERSFSSRSIAATGLAADDAIAHSAECAVVGSDSAAAAGAVAVAVVAKQKKVFKFHKSPYFRTSLGLFLFSYNSTSLSILAFFSCRSIDALDTSFISTNLSISCDSPTYSSLRVAFILLLVFIVILAPLTLLGLLIRGHHKKILRDPKTLSRWGIVYESYGDARYFYEVIVISRRILLIAITVLLVNDPTSMYVALTVANLVIYLLHTALLPFRTPKENALESFSLVALTLLSAFLIVYPPPFIAAATDSADDRRMKQAVLIILTFIPACILSGFVIVYLVGRIKAKVLMVKQKRDDSNLDFRSRKLQGRELSARSIVDPATAAAMQRQMSSSQLEAPNQFHSSDPELQSSPLSHHRPSSFAHAAAPGQLPPLRTVNVAHPPAVPPPPPMAELQGDMELQALPSPSHANGGVHHSDELYEQQRDDGVEL